MFNYIEPYAFKGCRKLESVFSNVPKEYWFVGRSIGDGGISKKNKELLNANISYLKFVPQITLGKIPKIKEKSLRKSDELVYLNVKTPSKGKMTYKVSSVPQGMKKYISVNKNGEVTLKKGAKKGKYKIDVLIAAKGKYLKSVKTATIIVK